MESGVLELYYRGRISQHVIWGGGCEGGVGVSITELGR